VLAEAQKLDSTTHHAARSLAQSRVRRAMELRGKPLQY
jgi:glutamate dehydrogenase (NAD(P)+)